MASKYTDDSADVSNLSNVTIELQRILNLIEDDENIPLVSLKEAVNQLVSLVPELDQMVSTVAKTPNTANDGLTNDESSSISLYSIEWKPRDKSFHVILNTTLQTANRILLKPWFPYLKLIMTALAKLPSDSTHLTLYHAVKLNLIAQYPVGRSFVWWGFTLCTMSLDFCNNEYILGQNGARTLFIIDHQSGKNIRKHLFNAKEQDVLLPPACQFQITSSFDAGNGLHIIHLKEIPAKKQLLNPVQPRPIILSAEKSKLGVPGPPRTSPVSPQLKVTFQEFLPENKSNTKRIQKTSSKPTRQRQRSTSVKRIDPKVAMLTDLLTADPVNIICMRLILLSLKKMKYHLFFSYSIAMYHVESFAR